MLEIVTKTAESQDNLLQTAELLEVVKKFFYRTGDITIEKKVSELAFQINEPLYLIVAGEYNSGKSSFINALCGEEILAAGPTPSTNKNTPFTFLKKKTS